MRLETKTPDSQIDLHGFTIVELLIVIVIIGILAAITVVAYTGIQQSAHVAVLQSDVRNASDQLEIDNVQTGTYPATMAAANGGAGLKASPGTTYQYTYTSSGNAYCLTGTNSGVSYFISNGNASPTSGGCVGHGVGGVAPITNLVRNPKAGANSSDWNSYVAPGAAYTSTRVASGGPSAAASSFYRVTWTTAPTGAGVIGSSNGVAGANPVTPGVTYTFAGYGKVSWSGAITKVQINWLDISGAGVGTVASGPATAQSPGVWARKDVSGIAPTGASRAVVYFRQDSGVGTLPPLNATFDATGFLLTEGPTLYNYADGDSPSWVWNGTLNNSTSTGPPL